MRKIIHVDMDCFYAAIELRDNPQLRGKPVAVGGAPAERGVLCTANYEARAYGVRSAQSTAYALKICPDLIVLPVDFEKYRRIAKEIHAIFARYSDQIEPLALDEAYLDVSDSPLFDNLATQIAKSIRRDIVNEQALIASAGVSCNKFLAKVASGWKKPNGLFVIPPWDVTDFVKTLSIQHLPGVGRVTEEKLNTMGVETCEDLQKYSLEFLHQHFGKQGDRLYHLCRGVDERPVESVYERKSLSVEHTFAHDLNHLQECLDELDELYDALQMRLTKVTDKKIHKQFIKIKFYDFKQTTAECVSHELNLALFQQLMQQAYKRSPKAVRLLGIGVGFKDQTVMEQGILEF